MSVLITMQVGPAEWEKFQSAAESMYGDDAPGRLFSRIYRSGVTPTPCLWSKNGTHMMPGIDLLTELGTNSMDGQARLVLTGRTMCGFSLTPQ